jgi:DNA-binding NtrC family response regulator
LIDDEAATRLVMHNRVRDLGHEVVSAENGAKGLSEARDGGFDLILIDAGLSGVTGLEVCRRLRHSPATSTVPLVLFSKSGASREEIHQGFEAGCDAFVTKAEMGNLEDVVRALLRIRAHQNELAQQSRAFEAQNRRLQEEQACAVDTELSQHGGGENALISRELAAGKPDGLLLVDAEGIVKLADRGARDLLGNTLQGKNLGRLAPGSGLEAFVRDARSETREGFRFDIPTPKGRLTRSLTVSVVPLMPNPGEKDPGLRVVVLLDAGKRRVASELLRTGEYIIPRREVGVLLDAARVAFGSSSFVGETAAIARIRARIAEAAQSTDPVLISGEEGTGKQHVARALHFNGAMGGPFVPLSCAALSESHLDSELFGQIKGAFPDAVVDRPGAVQQANHGTLYLQMIESLPPELQKKLLRLLQTGETTRAGSTRTEKAEVRVIAATSGRIQDEIDAGRFLPELYAALRTIEAALPPLRERRDDIPLLAQHFANRRGAELGEDVLAALQSHSWPGNVRELETVVERVCAQAVGRAVTIDDLPAPVRDAARTLPQRQLIPKARPSEAPVSGTHVPLARPAPDNAAVGGRPRADWEITDQDPISLDHYERKVLLRALDATRGDKLAAARLLKVGKSTLYRKLKRFNIA